MASISSPEKPRIIALFDVDGTLTIPRGEITPEMLAFMKELSKKVTVGIVGGRFLQSILFPDRIYKNLTS